MPSRKYVKKQKPKVVQFAKYYLKYIPLGFVGVLSLFKLNSVCAFVPSPLRAVVTFT